MGHNPESYDFISKIQRKRILGKKDEIINKTRGCEFVSQRELTCQGILLPWDLKNDSRRVTLSFFLIAAVFTLLVNVIMRAIIQYLSPECKPIHLKIRCMGKFFYLCDIIVVS